MVDKICDVCNEKISFFVNHTVRESLHSDDLIKLHTNCLDEFDSNPEKYGGKPIEVSDETTDIDEETKKSSDRSFKERQQLIKQYDKGISDIDFLTTLLISIFLGGLGIHRFFVGKTGTGILMLVTIGGLGIWWIIDIILIVTGSFTDIEGKVITYQNTNTANTAPSTHVPEKVVEAPPAKDIPAEIEKLADLKDKGIITDEEFQQKKQELLERI